MARRAKKQESESLWGDDLFAGLSQQPVAPARREVARDPRWTPPQFEGITSVGKDLLVSAAAGSGKTAILSERCAHLVCSAAAPYLCDVEELLVVTFTEKAAVEMKSRIIAALRRCAEADPSDRLRRQLALAEQAQVSTLHSFCTKVLRQHFHKVGLDPAFVVMDAEEARLMRTEVAREMFHQRYGADEFGDFQRLVDCYADGDDEQLVRQVIRTHEMLRSLVSPEKWLNETRQRLVEAAESGVESSLGAGLVALLRRRLNALQQRVAATIELCSRLFGGYPMYVALLSNLLLEMKDWQRFLDDNELDELARAVDASSFPKLPPVPNTTPDKETAKAAIESVREEYKNGPWRGMLRFTADEWRNGMARTLPHARVFLDLVEEFTDLYLQRKKSSRQLDFSDLERFTLEVLRDNRREELAPSATARLYHRLFKHVLVDEYQDINELQDAILKLLSHECLTGGNAASLEPNLFCVGDVKQSIYGFRLAEPKRFLEREKQYRNGAASSGQVIDLQANFRSRSPLLEAINGVFKRLMTKESADIEYNKSHELTAGQTFPDPGDFPCFSGSPIELHLLPQKLANGDGADSDDGDDDSLPTDLMLERTEREAVLVARRILQIVGLDGSAPMHIMEKGPIGLQPRPAQLKDVVVLLRSMRFKADEFSRILARFGIPTHSQSSTGYFDSVEVRDMLCLLALLDNQRQDMPLAAVLRSPLSGLEDVEDALATVRLRYGSRQKPVTFHEAVINYAREQDDPLAARLRTFLGRLDAWRLTAQRRPLADAIWSIYQETGYLAYVSGLAGGEQRVANLLHLHERAARFGSFQQRGLRRFLDYLESIRTESDLGEPSIASEAENVVKIMTVHGSKGLEFPIVIVPDLGKAINLQDSRGAILVDRQEGLGMSVVEEDRQISYPSLAWTLVQDRRRRQVMAEELRVLYVAMTRAREHLVLVGTCREEAESKWRDRWSEHTGALPADAVIDVRTVLDWLGPVAACATTPCEIIHMTTHPSAEVFAWTLPAAGRQGTPRLAAAVRFELLDPPPAQLPETQTVISRLSFRYPHEALAARKAVQSVTSAAKAVKSVAAPLPLPAALRDGGPVLSAADVGTATHLVLQHLDFSRPLDAAGIAAQIDELLGSRMLDSVAAARVDREAIHWFLGTEVGRLLRNNASILLRELPVYFKAQPDVAAEAAAVPLTALDEVMVRGRLDVFVPLAGGGVIVDYKTDGVDAAGVPLRAEEYRGQVEQYRQAMRTVTGNEVERAWLVFLKPRVVWGM